jgi:hypothetical protein
MGLAEEAQQEGVAQGPLRRGAQTAAQIEALEVDLDRAAPFGLGELAERDRLAAVERGPESGLEDRPEDVAAGEDELDASVIA